ncbi:hypothetical protein CR513_27623, partial [Mucuna pruriens]
MVKQHRINFDFGKNTITRILEYVHYDLWCYFQIESRGGCKYFLTFINDRSRIFGDEVLEKLKEKTMFETWTSKQVKTLIIDNILKFCNAPLNDFWNEEGIQPFKLVAKS